MKEYKPATEYHRRDVDQEKFLGLSPVIENAPYILAKNYDPKIAGSSTGASSSSSHSSNSSSNSASRAYVGSSGCSSNSSCSSRSSSGSNCHSSPSRATVSLEGRV